MSDLQSRALAGNEPFDAAQRRLSRPHAASAWLFAAAIFLSASLLFLVQPLFARMILPHLGGTPATWNTCLVFFQTCLLGGYIYVHVLTTRLNHRGQVLAHAVLLIVTLGTLPIALPGDIEAATGRPVSWLLGTLALSVGLPFFAFSATAPLIQRWYALRTRADPYFLYAASNAGSLMGLMAYPFVVEPMLTLDQQRRFWSMAFVAAIGLIVGCGVISMRLRDTARSEDGSNRRQASFEAVVVERLAWRDRLHWLLLSFVPSSLLLGVTLHISTDVAAVPLLWVVPLALYLLTFVAAFASRPPLSRVWMNRLAPLSILGAIAALVFNPPWLWGLTIHLVAFVVVALVCHRELAERRPAAEQLTAFYLWLSLGGALGGLFNAIVAPLVFTQVLEYPLALVLAALVRPTTAWARRGEESLIVLIALPLFVFGVIAAAWLIGLMPDIGGASLVSAFWLCAAALLAFSNRVTPFAMAVAAVMLSHTVLPRQEGTRAIFSARSFFGVHRVMVDTPPTTHRLFHGTTLHGWQAVEARERCEPTSYYHRTGPLGQVFSALGERARDVAVIGLGAGSLACYGRDDTTFTFYEIDPVVERVARDPSLFTYLSHARGSMRVVLGDGRVGLNAAPPQAFDVIIVDAFSSDAIPTHLLTQEFLEMATARLRPNGLLAFHISNRHLDLGPVLGATAAAAGLAAMDQYHSPALADASASRWLLAGPATGMLAQATAEGHWHPAPVAARGWTDDFSNILDALAWSPRAAAGVP